MWKTLELLFLIVVLFGTRKDYCCSASSVYTVSSRPNQCSKGIPKCYELSFYMYIWEFYLYFTSNMEFRFLSGTHILNTMLPVIISGISNITFTGQSTNDTPIIQCTDGSQGFAFLNTRSITLRSLIIDGCSPTIHDSALTVSNSSSLTLSDFTIRNTRGVGLMIYDVNILDIVRSNFSNNGLGISNCSLVTYQWWYSVNVFANDVEEVNYTITDTVFNGNTEGRLGGGLSCRITNAQSAVVTLQNSMFRGINGCLSAVSSITVGGYNLANITITNLSFIDNYRTDVPAPYNGSEFGGALSIVTSSTQLEISSVSSVHVVILNTVFVKNKARFCAGASVLTLNTVKNHVQVINSTFEGNEILLPDPLNYSTCSNTWTGGICISPGSVQSYNLISVTTVDVINSTFVSNVGHMGAALQLTPFLESSINNCRVTIKNSIFHSNNAFHDDSCFKSAIQFEWVYDSLTQGNIFVTIDNCTLTENLGYALITADLSDTFAIIHYWIKVYFKVIRCIFRANSMALFSIFKQSGILYDIKIQSSSFSEYKNKSSSIVNATIAVIGFSHSTVVNISDIHMFDNAMTPIYTDDCGLMFSGYNVIENNTALLGGGIHISGSGYAFVESGFVVFRNNRAIRGGALYSPRTVLTKSLYSLTCTFLSLTKYAFFINNTASIAGNNMYGGALSRCLYRYVDDGYDIFDLPNNCINCLNLSLPGNSEPVYYPSSSVNVSSDPFSVLLCDDSHNVLVNKSNVSYSYPFYPGQYVHLNITTTGYCNGFSPGFLKISAQGAGISEDDIEGQKIDESCKQLSFKPLLTQSNINTTVTVEIDVAHSLTMYIQTFPFTVFINVSSCPHGMFLDDKTKACQCNSSIEDYVEHCNISDTPNPFIKTVSFNNWIAYNENKKCISIAPICPFDYCSLSTDIYFNLDNTTDYQCSNNRTGTLCGQCQPGLSLIFGSNRCGNCSNYYLLLLLVFFVAGILLIIIIIFLNMTISIGMLNGLLFYANIVKLNETQLFSNGSIPVISHFISWLNLDLGFETCFYNGLDGYWKTWLQFAFPLYLWLVIIGIIIISERSIKFSRYLPKNIIPVLATLILVSFTKLLRTVTAVFMATRLRCGTHTELVWSVDGSIEYWSIKHSILMGFTVIIIMFVAVYTFLLLFSQCLQRATNYRICRCCLRPIMFWIHPFTDAHSGPFVPRYGYWTGVLVLIRIVKTIVFAYTSGSAGYINNYVIVAVEIIIFNVFHSGFYQSKLNYYCEKFFHINLCAICLVNAVEYGKVDSPYVTIVTIVSVGLSLLVCIAIIGWHGYKVLHRRCAKAGQPMLMLDEYVDDNDDNNAHESCEYASYSVHQKRDSIIYDSD